MDGGIAMRKLHFRIEQWNAGERTIAAPDNLIVPRAAFDAAAKPGLRLTLRDRARVIARHPETELNAPNSPCWRLSARSAARVLLAAPRSRPAFAV
jgi:hypothetical protein